MNLQSFSVFCTFDWVNILFSIIFKLFGVTYSCDRKIYVYISFMKQLCAIYTANLDILLQIFINKIHSKCIYTVEY